MCMIFFSVGKGVYYLIFFMYSLAIVTKTIDSMSANLQTMQSLMLLLI